MPKSADPDIRLLAALADPARLAIVRQLASDGSVCACDFLGRQRPLAADRLAPPARPARGGPGARGAAGDMDLVPPRSGRRGSAGGDRRRAGRRRARPARLSPRRRGREGAAPAGDRAGRVVAGGRSRMTRLRVATLNILNLADRWEERLPLLLADTAALRPDLLGLQEVVYPMQQDRLLAAGDAGRLRHPSTLGGARPSSATASSSAGAAPSRRRRAPGPRPPAGGPPRDRDAAGRRGPPRRGRPPAPSCSRRGGP